MQFIKTILFLAFAMTGMVSTSPHTCTLFLDAMSLHATDFKSLTCHTIQAAPADLLELDARQETDCACSGTVTVTVPADGIPATILGSSTIPTIVPLPTEPSATLPVYGTATPTPGVPAWTDGTPNLSSTALTAPVDTSLSVPVPTVTNPAVTGTITSAVTDAATATDVVSSIVASITSSLSVIATSATDGVQASSTESVSQGGGAAPTGAFGLGAMLGGAALVAMAL